MLLWKIICDFQEHKLAQTFFSWLRYSRTKKYEVSLQGTANDIEESNEEDEEIDLDKLSLLTGVKLPKRNSDWQIANNYFKIMVEPETITNENINTYVLWLQETIHSYFKEQYGNVGATQSHELYTSNMAR